MKIPEGILFFDSPVGTGDEDYHVMTFFNQLRAVHPELAAIAVHIPNEGKRTAQQIQRAKLMGLVTGASDIIIPAKKPLLLEAKVWKGKLTTAQTSYLLAGKAQGAVPCVGVGYVGMWNALNFWLRRFN